MSIFQKVVTRAKLLLKRLVIDSNIFSSSSIIGREVVSKGVITRGDVRIGSGCKLSHVYLDGNISIGRNTSLWGPNITVKSQINPITIGNYCSIAKNVTIQECNHNVERFSTYYLNKNVIRNLIDDNVSKGPIIIEHDVWVGDGVKILSGVRIGTGAVIGANSVVTKNVPPYAIVGGVPARIIAYRFEDAVIERLLLSKWWELDPEELVHEIPNLDLMCGSDAK